MAVGLNELPELIPVSGVRLGTTSAGIKKPGRKDLVIIAIPEGAHVAAVFTRNAFCAAPVTIAKAHLQQATPSYLLINTGNANAGTGERGVADALACCRSVAETSGCAPSEVLPFSTGVIGEPLPVEQIIRGIPHAIEALSEAGWAEAAHGIMTTDTVPKGVSRQLQIEGRTVTITGIAKGAGMIRPDMATMLAFIATDAAVDATALQACLDSSVHTSFNRITIDGDTSTNDSCVLIASGAAGNGLLTANHPAFASFAGVVREVCERLAQAIVRDGEGATKFITVDVSGGRSEAECEAAAFTIAQSPLVKTALFASDPNWGRILAAVGRAGIEGLDVAKVDIYLGDVCIVRGGGRAAEYEESAGQRVMAAAEISIRVELGRGEASARVWTCDFSYDYVRINAEYRT